MAVTESVTDPIHSESSSHSLGDTTMVRHRGRHARGPAEITWLEPPVPMSFVASCVRLG